MVDQFTLVLAGLVVYLIIVVLARMGGLLPENVSVWGPILTIRTQKGKRLLDRIARRKRAWRAWGNLGAGIALVVLALSFLLVVLSGLETLANPEPSQITQPRNVLAIPGVNDFLPLSMAPEILFGLAIGLIVHEGGHGIFCRVADIDVESMGIVMLTVLPMGAFVEPDEADRAASERGDQLRMFAAGVTNNFALAAIAFVLLFGPVAGSIAVVDGAHVGGAHEKGAASAAGIDGGDVITSVEGTPVANASAMRDELAATEDASVSVGLDDGETVTVERHLLVVGTVGDAPLATNDTLAQVNGTAVATGSDLRDALVDREVARFETESGRIVTAPAGAAVVATNGSRAAEAGLQVGREVTVTAVDGERVITGEDFRAALAERDGEAVTLAVRDDEGRRTISVAVPDDGPASTRPLGLLVAPGVSGMQFDDFGVRPYPADRFLDLMTAGDGDGVGGIQRAVLVLLLPLFAAAGGSEFGFAGFDATVQNFYEVTGVLAGLGDGVFALANVLFWTAWINLVIGQFNCVPAYPLDGGHILRVSVEGLVSRLPIGGRRRLVSGLTTGITLLMLVALVAIVALPRILS